MKRKREEYLVERECRKCKMPTNRWDRIKITISREVETKDRKQ